MADELKNQIEALKNSTSRTHYFIQHNDTYNGMPWVEFIKVVERYGFKLGYYNIFKGEDNIYEREALYYLEEKGLVLHVYTKGGVCINWAELYGEFNAPHSFNLNDFFSSIQLYGGLSYFRDMTKTVSFYIDVKEGFNYITDTIVTNFDLNAKWHSGWVSGFYNYMEREDEFEEILPLISYNKVRNCDELNKIIFSGYIP